MGDADDAVVAAVAANRRLAASRLARKEELEAELRALGEAAPGAGTAARAEAISLELATVTADYEAAVAEIAELKRIAATQARAPLATSEDALLRSAEETALDNARAYIAELDAQARLGEDLAPAAETPPPPDSGDADADALAAFKQLREKRGKKTL